MFELFSRGVMRAGRLLMVESKWGAPTSVMVLMHCCFVLMRDRIAECNAISRLFPQSRSVFISRAVPPLQRGSTLGQY